MVGFWVLRTLSWINGWYLPSHANFILQTMLDFLPRTALLRLIMGASRITPPDGLRSGVALW